MSTHDRDGRDIFGGTELSNGLVRLFEPSDAFGTSWRLLGSSRARSFAERARLN